MKFCEISYDLNFSSPVANYVAAKIALSIKILVTFSFYMNYFTNNNKNYLLYLCDQTEFSLGLDIIFRSRGTGTEGGRQQSLRSQFQCVQFTDS